MKQIIAIFLSTTLLVPTTLFSHNTKQDAQCILHFDCHKGSLRKATVEHQVPFPSQSLSLHGCSEKIPRLANRDVCVAEAVEGDPKGETCGQVSPLGTLQEWSAYTDNSYYIKDLGEATARASINTATYGGNLGENFLDEYKNSAIDALGRDIAGAIGDEYAAGSISNGPGNLDYWKHKGAHALLGCGIGQAKSGDCGSGAGGAVIAEVVGEAIGKGLVEDGEFSDADRWLLKTASTTAAVFGTSFAGGDAEVAQNTAENAIENNLWGFLLKQLAKIAAKKATKKASKEAVKQAGKKSFELVPRVIEQLKDPRLGKLAGKLDNKAINKLLKNNKSKRVYDTKSGYINVYQKVNGIFLRITTPRGSNKVISVGPYKPKNILNGIRSGRYKLLQKQQ